jgi:pimeloyl-ACP methyl ester carboxylesterase
MTVAFESAGQGPAVVFLHPFPFDRSVWADQLAAVAAAGFRGLAPDLPGFGETPLPGDREPSLDLYVDAVVGLMDGLSIDRAVVVGLSMGGYVALAMAGRVPSRVAGLVLADTRATADAPTAKAARVVTMGLVRSQGVGALADRLLPGLLAPEASSELRSRLRAVAARQPVPGVVAALQAMRDRHDASDTLSALMALRVPVLVLVGEHDAVTPPDEGRALAAAIPGARFALVPAAGHLAQVENPADFDAALLGFLAGCALGADT